MTMNRLRPTLLTALLTLLVAAIGYYMTDMRQATQLGRLQAAQSASAAGEGAFDQLVAQVKASTRRVEEATRKWKARYRHIPDTLSTPDVIEYLTTITDGSYEAFSVRLNDTDTAAEVNRYVFDVNGTASYRQLYDFVWEVENSPEFYRIHDLEIARTVVTEPAPGGDRRERDMVRFDLRLEAYFAGSAGLGLAREHLAQPPAQFLPISTLPHDSFYPLVQPRPPNDPDENLLDIETAELVSIAGSRAIFQDGNTQHVVYEGTAVRNGSIIKIDPIDVVVRARLRTNGRSRIVNLRMSTDAPEYRQAEGRETRLVPVETRIDSTARSE